MSSNAYKKFTAQDISVVPFNAHKHYKFDSSSASTNSINNFNTRFTSESFSLYSSASTNPNDLFDPINTLKYNQINHLFYKDFIIKHHDRFGNFKYKTQKRNLYEKAQILSLPAGLFGAEIKPGSFYLSSSNQKVVDDNYGNLIISGTNIDNFPTDVDLNIFRLDPVNGYKKYDLAVHKDYAVVLKGDKEDPTSGDLKLFYKRGEIKTNAPQTYTTPEGSYELDDSYFVNTFSYSNVNFATSSLGSFNHKFPSIEFHSTTGSHIVIPHDEKYNFERDDDFSISFYMEPKTPNDFLPLVAVGDDYQGGVIVAIDGEDVYIADKRAYDVGKVPHDPLNDIQGWGLSNIISSPGAQNTGLGGGITNTKAIADEYGDSSPYIACAVTHSSVNPLNYNDWYLPNEDELQYLINYTNTTYGSGLYKEEDNGLYKGGWFDQIVLNGTTPEAYITTAMYVATSTEISSTQFKRYNTQTNIFDPFQKTGPTFSSFRDNGRLIYIPFRKASYVLDNTKRYIIAKSSTKTNFPTGISGEDITIEPDNMHLTDGHSQPQFPFEIYMQSQSIYFARSDGENIFSLTAEVTGSDGSAKKPTHILCQNSSSRMEIYFDGVLKTSSSITSSLKNEVRNLANLYIGSKGKLSSNDSTDPNHIYKYFNGNLSNINIFQRAFNDTEIINISESINASPYIGNLFYQNGFATITHPKYHSIFGDYNIGNMGVGNNFVVGSEEYHSINKLQFEGSHLMYENEYQCTVDEYEYNQTMNPSARKQRTELSTEFADFVSSSYFKPYVTTIGLYNENNDLLVVGKLGQPIRMSDETDTTFIMRWDT